MRPAQAVVDANALRILDQEIRDADTALGKARDDLAGLVARRRILEKEVQGLHGPGRQVREPRPAPPWPRATRPWPAKWPSGSPSWRRDDRREGPADRRT